MARNKMLAFKRIDSNEFPLRQLPLDTLDVLNEEDGFDHIFTTTGSITTSASTKAKKSKKKNKEQNVEVFQK